MTSLINLISDLGQKRSGMHQANLKTNDRTPEYGAIREDGMDNGACTIGSGIQVRGHLSGSGNLVVQGRVEGHVVLQAHVIVKENGSMVADVEAQELTVHGKMSGNTTATERVSISSGATVVGDLRSPRIVLEDGARFRGTIEMDVPLPADI